MAIQKEMILDNGVIVQYHRIVSVNKITNQNNIIEVASYPSKQKREEEKNAIKNGEDSNIFIHTQYINAKYDENTKMKDCYEYLKTIEEFKDSQDG